ncbi:nucleoside triphosphate pyrophosphohydrolase family protein [Nocardia flavorosea]|uniref:Nucleoside triphosphate pyrophosphohydrolase family protein n=2 Tax=Nocardia flavorosea TaxID=53429 RepID=A0A846YPR8_9NOCA|nr:nucleoside triphosphate pyrophosphohydrolase family protein [Nocardia flavorosea]
MDFDEYQSEAWAYDQNQEDPERALTIALLGLGGEVGTLQTNQKKIVRDGSIHRDHHTVAVEDLGDILWYVADTATWLGVRLDEVASANLSKIASRWPRQASTLPTAQPRGPVRVPTAPVDRIGPARSFDTRDTPETQRLPRQLEVLIAPSPHSIEGQPPRVVPVSGERACGDPLGDNAYDEDGYRYHDVFHLAHLAILGWSPVMRALLKRKRKANPRVDDVEDGGRAIAIEEGLSAFVFEAAGRASYFAGATVVDSEILRLCRRMTANLEVGVCTEMEWEKAILDGFRAWRAVHEHGDAAVLCDLDARTLTVRPLTDAERRHHTHVCERAIAEKDMSKRLGDQQAASV